MSLEPHNGLRVAPARGRGRGLSVLRREFVRKIRQVGVLGTIHLLAEKLITRNSGLGKANGPDPFDTEFHTSTADIVSVGALDIPDRLLAEIVRYEPVAPDVFGRILARIPIRHEHFTFLDIGSGKGRALLLASSYPFREVIGIELSKELTAVAIRNIELYKNPTQKCFSLHAVCGDATQFSLPPHNTVLFLYNPFGESLMRRLVDNIESSLRAVPRQFYVAYHRPLQKRVWEGCRLFRTIAEEERFVIYAAESGSVIA